MNPITVTKSRTLQVIDLPQPKLELSKNLFSEVWDRIIDSGHDVQYMDGMLEELVGVVDFFQQYRDIVAQDITFQIPAE